MSRVEITPTKLNRIGTVEVPAQTVVNTTEGNLIPANGGRTLIEVENASGGTGTITFLIPANQDGVSPENSGKKISILTTKKIMFGPFPPGVYNQTSGAVYFNSSVAFKARVYEI